MHVDTRNQHKREISLKFQPRGYGFNQSQIKNSSGFTLLLRPFEVQGGDRRVPARLFTLVGKVCFLADLFRKKTEHCVREEIRIFRSKWVT